MIVLDTNVISELRKALYNQDLKVCAWSHTQPASAFHPTTLTIMEIERATLILMIAAIALEFGYALATRNVAHFNFPGLVVVDPWA